MMHKTGYTTLAILSVLLLAPVPGRAQTFVPLPEQSPRASVGERIGLCDVAITYHRPFVRGRKIWNTAIVPYDQLWRAGANESTTIEFSDPVLVEGQPVARGAYALFLIPTAKDWTLILSKNTTQWGTYTYDKAEDALRVSVKPRAATFEEALSYTIEDVKPDSATVILHWEKLAVPFRVTVPAASTLQHIKDELRGGTQWNWDGWNDAASYCVDQKIGLEDALVWADKSIAVEERFENLMTKAGALEALHRTQEVAPVRARAMEIANASQLYFHARGLQGNGKASDAFAEFKSLAKRYPAHWLSHVGLARVYSAEKKFQDAEKELVSATQATSADQQKQTVETLLKRIRAHEDIN
jgi:hypothetical protein